MTEGSTGNVMAVAIGKVRPLASQKMVRKEASPLGVAMSPAAIVATTMIMCGFKRLVVKGGNI